jgi:hypothetical protein
MAVREMKQDRGETRLAYTRIVERYALLFDRPEMRLRFLNKTLAQQHVNEQKVHKSLRRLAFLENTRLYRWLMELSLYRLIFEELQATQQNLPADRQQALSQINAPRSALLFFQLYRVRYAFYALGAGLALAGLFGLYFVGASAWKAGREYLARRFPRTIIVQNGGQNGSDNIDYLPDFDPKKFWLVEKKDNYEQYSNGARVITEFEVDNHPRQYYVARRGMTATEPGVKNEIVGIVYHTSENDMLPFTPDNSGSIQAKSRGLLNYVREGRRYNYLIDRFGQIYRVVRDEQAAYHAGHSVWADKENVYVNLNESFLGICFESSMEQALRNPAEQLTEAQILAGRQLTNILRAKYNIDGINCVTHGIVAVSPQTMKICRHYDGARNFPFAAMNVSDNYQVVPASVSEFGFTYDNEIVELLGGEVWQGVLIGVEEFKHRATTARVSEKELRQQMLQRYNERVEAMRKLRSEDAPSPD